MLKRLIQSDLFLIGALAFFVILMFADNVATWSNEQAVNRAASSLVTNAGPSIQNLSEIARTLHQLSLRAAGDGTSRPRLSRAEAGELVGEAWSDWAAYRRLPSYAGEEQLQEAAESDWRTLRTAAEAFDGSSPGNTRLVARAEQVRDDVFRIIDLNAQNAKALGEEVNHAHGRIRKLSLLADEAAIVLMVGIGMMVIRRVRRVRRDLEVRNLEIAERAEELEAFSGRMAHDVLSPLGGQLIAWQMLERAYPDDERVSTWAGRSRAALRRTQQLVQGLLGFALAGARPDPNASADVDATLADVLEGLRPEAEAAGVALSLDSHGQRVAACSPGVLTSIALNLVRNAIKYIGEGAIRAVEMTSRPCPGGVHVEVRDTGPGIPADSLQRIFEPYVRGPNHQESGAAGVGLGLATVKRLCEAHGGRVGVSSSVGKGSTFWFELPERPVARRGATEQEQRLHM